jgi:hypothetical protein
MPVRDERGTEMFIKDPVDTCDIRSKRRAGITRRGDRDFPRLCTACAPAGKDRCMTAIAPAEENFAKV